MKNIFIILLLLFTWTAQANIFNPNQSHPEVHTVLPLEQAFQLQAQADEAHLYLEIAIANQCCYLYQHALRLESKTEGVTLALPTLPAGIEKEDDLLGPMVVYEDTVSITVPRPQSPSNFGFVLHYQGCAKSGFCYPPVSQRYQVENNEISAIPTESAVFSNSVTATAQSTLLTPAHFTLLSFFKYFSIGLLLAFTPCILPMLPILSGIILGQKTIGWKKSLGLSLSYVLAMSATYAIAGILAATLGVSLQGMLQTPWVIGSFALLLVLMALWLFEVINLSSLNRLYDKLEPWSRRQRWANAYVSAAVMGILATLIASPCVTAPLIGVLSYIAQTQDRLYGGLALFSMGLGLGTPLLLIAVLGPQILPKRGPWMQSVSQGFGVVLVGLAISLLDRMMAGHITLMLWAAWFIWISMLLGIHRSTASFYGSRLASIALCYGLLLGLGAWNKETSVSYPLRAVFTSNTPSEALTFIKVGDLKTLQAHLAKARAHHQPVFLDFYADWCVSCQHMEQYFKDPEVVAQLTPWMRLQVDMTKLTPEIRQIMGEYQVIAPPTFIFYDAEGSYLSQKTQVGEISKKDLLQLLDPTSLP